MTEPFRVFIGYDQREAVAYHVLSHSILVRASIPVSITPLRRQSLPMLTKPRAKLDSTDFAISRFLVPALCNFEGFALYLDCDMLCLDDVVGLYNMALMNAVLNDWNVAVVKHNYIPRNVKKFLGQPQTKYAHKNWSSVMLFNCEHCPLLTPAYVNNASGLALHQFDWSPVHRIGVLPAVWNNLIGEDCELPLRHSVLLHYTNGGPWFPNCAKGTKAEELWKLEYEAMVQR